MLFSAFEAYNNPNNLQILAHPASLAQLRTYAAPPSENSDKNSPFRDLCYLRFWYHMYGNHVGKLSLQLKVN